MPVEAMTEAAATSRPPVVRERRAGAVVQRADGAARTRGRAAVALLAVVALGVPSVVAAQPSTELERDLVEVEREAERVESELGAVRDEIAVAEAQLAAIAVRLEDARGRLRQAEGQVALAEAALLDARELQAAAEADHVRAEDLLLRAEQELADQEAVLVDQLVHTFKYGTAGATRGAMAIEVLRRAEDPNAFAVGMKQLRAVVGDQDQTVQRVFELRDRRAGLADDAARARGRASQAAADASTTLTFVEELRAQAVALTAEVAEDEARQRTVLGSLRTSEDQTAALLVRVEARTRQLQQDLAEQRAREEAERRRLAEEAARRAAEEAARRAAQDGAGRGAVAAAPGSGAGRLGLPGADGGPDVADAVCPVVGAVAGRDFSNDWGYPRSGGRYHQGNDVFASRGTPVVAVDDGMVVRVNPPTAPTALGGVTVSYRTADGSEWYNAHLDTLADGIAVGAPVRRGETIGTVGNSGNARTTPPHLHIGRRLAGAWVNPWPTIAPTCR